MATVRVFMPTYRRTRLLERAVNSLRTQTFRDWVCEVHNDDPADDAPRQLLARTGDARFSLVRHERNLGGTATFNLLFRTVKEPFYAMLEDDNWWEPGFLSKLLSAAERHPTVTLCWANMRVWEEQEDGAFLDTGRCVHTCSPSEPARSFDWGQPAQMCGALHSHGAALVRSRPGDDFETPLVPIAAVEPFRERCLPHPLLFIPEPLAHFSITRRSARSDDRAEWAEVQTVLAATFLKHAGYDAARLAEVWARARAQRPPATSTLLFAGLIEPACRPLLRHARAADWLRLARGTLRRPGVLRRVLRSRRLHPEWWEFLERHTAARFAEARSRP